MLLLGRVATDVSILGLDDGKMMRGERLVNGSKKRTAVLLLRNEVNSKRKTNEYIDQLHQYHQDHSTNHTHPFAILSSNSV